MGVLRAYSSNYVELSRFYGHFLAKTTTPGPVRACIPRNRGCRLAFYGAIRTEQRFVLLNGSLQPQAGQDQTLERQQASSPLWGFTWAGDLV